MNSWKNRVFGDKISSCTDLQSYDVQCCMSSRFRKPVTTDVVSVTVIPSSCFVWQFQIHFLVCFLVVGTTSVMRFLFGLLLHNYFNLFSREVQSFYYCSSQSIIQNLGKKALKSNAMSFQQSQFEIVCFIDINLYTYMVPSS